jgi:hypothetical protein
MRWLSCRNRDPLTDTRPSPSFGARRIVGAGALGAVIVAITALALPGIGTSEAHLDPNRYGVRTVDAAGGSVASVTVRFTVRPVIAVVVRGNGAPKEVWSNLGRTPSESELAAARFRSGAITGREISATPALLASAATAFAQSDWVAHGLIWHG